MTHGVDLMDWTVDYAQNNDRLLKRTFDLPLPGMSLEKRLAEYLRMPSTPLPHPGVVTGLRMDAGLLSLIRAQGVVPENLIALNHVGGIVMTRHGVRGNDTSTIQGPVCGRTQGHAFLGFGIRWIAERDYGVRVRFERRMHRMPDAVAAAVVGKPLDALMSHPALNHLPYRVKHLQEEKHHLSFWLEGVDDVILTEDEKMTPNIAVQAST